MDSHSRRRGGVKVGSGSRTSTHIRWCPNVSRIEQWSARWERGEVHETFPHPV
jgi:hypothetical protein